MCTTRDHSSIKILNLHPKRESRIWTIPAIHGNLERLTALHDYIYEHFQLGDRLVYQGNYIGYSQSAAVCIDEILTFRRMILSIPGVIPFDITYLRGTQEEIWKGLFQLPFDLFPMDHLLWMLGNGLQGSLSSYGFCQHDALDACRQGTVALTRFVNSIRDTLRNHAGHELFYQSLKRAACTAFSSETQLCSETPLLFVHAGLDWEKTLSEQGDAFWQGSDNFESMSNPYQPFDKVIRGFDPYHRGADFNPIKATTDNGCGFGGNLISAAFMPNGEIAQILEA